MNNPSQRSLLLAVMASITAALSPRQPMLPGYQPARIGSGRGHAESHPFSARPCYGSKAIQHCHALAKRMTWRRKTVAH